MTQGGVARVPLALAAPIIVVIIIYQTAGAVPIEARNAALMDDVLRYGPSWTSAGY